MKRSALLPILILMALLQPGCKDAPVDPSTGTPITDQRPDTSTPGPGPVVTDTCVGCFPSGLRPIYPFFAFAYKKSTSDTDFVTLAPEGPVVAHKVALYPNGTPKVIDLKMMLQVPYNFYPGIKDVWRVQVCIFEVLPLGTLKPPFAVKADPGLGFTGVAINYRHPSTGLFQRLSTGDTVGGQGPGQGHSEAQLKFERIDTTNHVISLWLKDMKFVLTGSDPVRYITLAPIYVKIPY